MILANNSLWNPWCVSPDVPAVCASSAQDMTDLVTWVQLDPTLAGKHGLQIRAELGRSFSPAKWGTIWMELLESRRQSRLTVSTIASTLSSNSPQGSLGWISDISDCCSAHMRWTTIVRQHTFCRLTLWWTDQVSSCMILADVIAEQLTPMGTTDDLTHRMFPKIRTGMMTSL